MIANSYTFLLCRQMFGKSDRGQTHKFHSLDFGSMQKNKEISHAAITTVVISTIFITAFMLSGSQFSQQALAIHEGGSTTATAQNQVIGGNATTTGATSQNQTTAPDTTNTQNQTATETGATATQTQSQAAATQEPPVNQNFVRQGTVASEQDPLPGHEAHEIAFVLPPRNDGAVYSGVLTYTASKPVEVVVLHKFDPQNSTDVPEAYGTELTSTLPGDGGNVAITLFRPSYEAGINSASVPFTGNALALHMLEDDPFTATYTVNAFATQPEDANQPLEFTSAEAPSEEDTTAGDEGDAGDEAGDEDTTAGDEDTTG
ncbi:MAG TPA: hypothetical protein VFS97_10680 [Nitrososphaeraceae archaeon]|nr:hypothetical protein [Nitrososphaeraceae archaeon]